MHRRELLPLMAGLVLGPAARTASAAAPAETGFGADTVRALARDLAEKPYQPPDSALPDALKNLDYAAYRTVRFDRDKALWRGLGGKFTVQFFSRGYLFKDRVDIFEVADGRVTPIRYAADMFDLGRIGPVPDGDLGFAGFCVQFPLNRADTLDEICSFLGASYFRAVARGQGYGMSARGLAIKTADPAGEEFPLFQRFWLERPARDSDVLVIHALLDSPSAAAAFRFSVRPGAETTVDTEMALYPRTELTQAGLAPMTSMFLFDANNRAGFDDYRAAVHDSNGLGLLTGRGEHAWRTLNNPHTLQISAFEDASPRGFGMVQRKRRLRDYQDLDAAYENRPSLWVEPIGDWGQGALILVEIPSDREINDNMVALWRPANKLTAKVEYLLAYRLHWCGEPATDAALAQVIQTRCGLVPDGKNRQFIVDFSGGALKDWSLGVKPDIDLGSGSSKNKPCNAMLQLIPGEGTWRLAFELPTGDERAIDLHARLLAAGKPISETWIYRWTA